MARISEKYLRIGSTLPLDEKKILLKNNCLFLSGINSLSLIFNVILHIFQRSRRKIYCTFFQFHFQWFAYRQKKKNLIFKVICLPSQTVRKSFGKLLGLFDWRDECWVKLKVQAVMMLS